MVIVLFIINPKQQMIRHIQGNYVIYYRLKSTIENLAHMGKTKIKLSTGIGLTWWNFKTKILHCIFMQIFPFFILRMCFIFYILKIVVPLSWVI